MKLDTKYQFQSSPRKISFRNLCANKLEAEDTRIGVSLSKYTAVQPLCVYVHICCSQDTDNQNILYLFVQKLLDF